MTRQPTVADPLPIALRPRGSTERSEISAAATRVALASTGYRDLHPDPTFNYELNRWLGALPELAEPSAARHIVSIADWVRTMLSRATHAAAADQDLEAAFFYRAAEFYMDPDEPSKAEAYASFRRHFGLARPDLEERRTLVPFDGGSLPVIDLPARNDECLDVVLLHGGFDSFLEEFIDWAEVLNENGLRVLLFEGPGQGAALREHGLTMAPDWERPVSAVLDHFSVSQCTIIGVSLGGYLAPRAAAFEQRIKRVVTLDVLDDFFDCFIARAPGFGRALRALTDWNLRTLTNRLVATAAARQPHLGWTFRHGQDVSGASDPFDFIRWTRSLSTANFSNRITQDVLLLAGSEDHIVPVHQLWRQAAHLTSARSVTVRLFTQADQGHQHCQIGNVKLALDETIQWIGSRVRRRPPRPS